MMFSDLRKSFWHDLRPNFGSRNWENAIFKLNFVYFWVKYKSYMLSWEFEQGFQKVLILVHNWLTKQRYTRGRYGNRKNTISELNFVCLWYKYNSFLPWEFVQGFQRVMNSFMMVSCHMKCYLTWLKVRFREGNWKCDFSSSVLGTCGPIAIA